MQVARIVKKNCDATVVLGGVHGTFTYQDVLTDNPDIDFIVVGEGEYTMVELCRHIRDNAPREQLPSIMGIAYRDGGTVFFTGHRPSIESLDELPSPAYHLAVMPDIEEYFSHSRSLPLLTSRGCPFKCAFCSTSKLHHRKYRARSVTAIVDEMEAMIATYSVDNFRVTDDLFTQNAERAKAICFEIIRRKLNIKWGCSARVDTITPDLLRIMKNAGCEGIFLGVESLDDAILARIQKGYDSTIIRRAVKWVLDEGIVVDTSFIIGLPGDSLKNFAKSGGL
jgi:radical SAM superfamily enzyme YgiQ (UPF0313 family)